MVKNIKIIYTKLKKCALMKELNNNREREDIKMKTNHAKSQYILEKVGLNAVTCGHCGELMYHKTKKNLDKISCYHCLFKGEPCDFPDYYYSDLDERFLRGELK